MSRKGLTAVDLVPLGERMRMISAFRALAVAVILLAWVALPASRGASLPAVATVSLVYLAATLGIELFWRRSDHPMRFLFGLVAMADSVFFAWASYGTAGLDTPLKYLVLLQLITVCLLASFRTGLKLALFNTWLLLGAAYLQEGGVANVLGGQVVHFGDAAFTRIVVDVLAYFLVTLVTTSFSAVNERELRRRRYDLEELSQFAMRLDETDDPHQVATCLLDGIADIYGLNPSTVLRRDAGSTLKELASLGMPDTNADALQGRSILALEQDCPVIGHTMASDQTLLVRTGKTRDAVLDRYPTGTNVAIIPLHGEHGVVTGALVAEQPATRGSRIERRAVAMMERFASHGSLALENAYLMAEVRALSITDPLTGLANRRHLDNTLDRACQQVARGHGTLSLMMIDIDHFKRLNDTYGHQTGDDVLRLVAKALESDLRAGDLAARYGGEEFSIVMPAAHGAEVRMAAERVREAITRIEHDIDVTISVGIAWAPEHGVSREELFKAADGALYAAKEGGRNRVMVAATPGYLSVAEG